MLPFSKRTKADEIEIEDADIVVLEEAAIEIDVADLELAEAVEVDDGERPQLPRVSPPPKSSLRRLLTSGPSATPRDRFEDDVADECLKSIAAATSRTRLSDSFPSSIVPTAPRLPHFESSIDELLADAPLPQFELSDTDETTRRPALSSSSAMPIALARDSVPGVLPIPAAPLSVSSIPTPVFSRTTSSPSLSAASSIAPVSMNSTPGPVEPTVILVRQPPKAAWVAAAAFLGAACALLGMHLLTRSADRPQTIVVTAPPPPTQATPAAPPPPPATVRFNDDQGVAVVAPPPASAVPASAPAPAPAPAPKPVFTTAAVKTAAAPAPAVKATSLGPKLPDGSMALTKAPSPPAAQPAAQAPAAPQPQPAPPAQPSQKKLTPEQQLAEAQLKASMR